MRSWLAEHLARPAWHVARDARARALNGSAEAVDPARVAQLALAVVGACARDAGSAELDVLALGEDEGGGFLVVLRSEPSALERALAEARRLWRLSPRQVEVVRELCEGCEAGEIAEKLGISWHTARDHVQAVLDKAGCERVVEMMGKMLKMG
ncbi:MAG: response regulator transcription factor [Deltaproteobacteria bacterium]|nr:response regulator transcription factor [Deltaproteobacteria bacterium]